MSFRKASRKAEDVKQGGSNYITGSGCYPVTLLAAIVSVGEKGSESVDLYVDHEGQKQVVYGNLRITNNDGSENKIGSKIFNQLIIIAGLDEVADPVEHELPIGKNEANKTAAVLEDLCDLDVILRVQMEYGVYNGNITEKKIIKSFFRAEDKAAAEEIVNETEAGALYEKEQKYVDHVTYKDVTPEQVQAWIAAGRPKGTATGNSEGAQEAPGFGKKRSFGNK